MIPDGHDMEIFPPDIISRIDLLSKTLNHNQKLLCNAAVIHINQCKSTEARHFVFLSPEFWLMTSTTKCQEH